MWPFFSLWSANFACNKGALSGLCGDMNQEEKGRKKNIKNDPLISFMHICGQSLPVLSCLASHYCRFSLYVLKRRRERERERDGHRPQVKDTIRTGSNSNWHSSTSVAHTRFDSTVTSPSLRLIAMIGPCGLMTTFVRQHNVRVCVLPSCQRVTSQFVPLLFIRCRFFPSPPLFT